MSALFGGRDIYAPMKTDKGVNAAVFLAALTLLLLGLNKGADLGWTSSSVLGLMAGALIFMAMFILIERRSPHPMLDLNLFRTDVGMVGTAKSSSPIGSPP